MERLERDVVLALQAGERIRDDEFDSILPPALGRLSSVQWSSVRVAHAIRKMLASSPSASFLDLGCGVGKLCLLLSLSTDLRVTGVERRIALVETCRRLARANGSSASFIAGDMMDLDWTAYDVLYLYNPFMEHKCSRFSRNLIDRNIRLGESQYSLYVDQCFAKLCGLRAGQRVITFHGFGGAMPANFKMVASERVGSGTVRLWNVC